MKKTILIADDHPIIRNGAIQIIKELRYWDIEFFQAGNMDEVIQVITDNHIDLLLLDINMPGVKGFRSIEDVRKVKEDIKILIFSSYEEKTHALRYTQAGANGYLQKDTSNDEIKVAVESVLERGKYISRSLIENIAFNKNAENLITKNPFESLSNREIEVCQLLVKGRGTLDIAKELDLKNSTVSTYKTRIFEKLNIDNISDLIVLYQQYTSLI